MVRLQSLRYSRPKYLHLAARAWHRQPSCKHTLQVEAGVLG